MSYRTNPENLRNLKGWLFETSYKDIWAFRQNAIMLSYITSYLESKQLTLINYSSKFSTHLGLIWLTYYQKIQVKDKNRIIKKKTKHSALYNKVTNPKALAYFYKTKTPTKKEFLKLIKKNLTSYNLSYKALIRNSKLTQYKMSFKDQKQLKNKDILIKIDNTRKFSKKLEAIFKDRILTLQLNKYIYKFFKINTQLYVKNVKRFLKNSARKLNKKLFNRFRFYKKFKFFKDALIIINISTYCRTPEILSDYLVNQLCRLRNQWPIINITTKILQRVLSIRSNIKGCKLLISGRLQGRDRKKTFIKVFGTLPLQEFSTNITYSLSQDYNIFGMFGVRVWLYYL